MRETQAARTFIAQGIAPSTQRKTDEAMEKAGIENTFELLAREWYATRKACWGDGYAKRVIGALELHVFPKLGKCSYLDITSMEWMDMFRIMEKKGILDQLGNVRRYCKEIYNMARVTGRAVNNPVDGLDKFLQSKQSENYAHISEERLQKLLRAMTAYSGARAVKLGLRLLIINGMRPSEVREAHWSEFDLEGVMWTIPAERMKKGREYLVPLSTQSLAILQ